MSSENANLREKHLRFPVSLECAYHLPFKNKHHSITEHIDYSIIVSSQRSSDLNYGYFRWNTNTGVELIEVDIRLWL